MATRYRDQCVECGEVAFLRHDLCPICHRARPAHVPYVGNWKIGRSWPISKIDPDERSRRGRSVRSRLLGFPTGTGTERTAH